MQDILQKLIRVAAAAMAVIYLAAGLFLAFAPVDVMGLGQVPRIVTGSLVFFYGIFRFARALKKTPVLVV